MVRTAINDTVMNPYRRYCNLWGNPWIRTLQQYATVGRFAGRLQLWRLVQVPYMAHLKMFG